MVDATRPSAGSRALPAAPPRRFRSLASRLVLIGLAQLVLLAVTGTVIALVQGPRGEADPRDVIDAKVLARLEALADDPTALTAALEDIEEQRVEVSIYDGAKQLIASNVDPPLAIPARRRRPRARRPGAPPAELGTRPSDHDGGPPSAPPPGEPGTASPAPPPREHGTASPDDGGPRLAPPSGERHSPALDRRAMVVGFHLGGARSGERGYLVARGVHRRASFVGGPLLALICGFAIMVLGALVTARWIVRPIDRLSRTARAIGAGDLAARSRLRRADEIGELGDRIDEMAERIERLLVTEKELLANVAHELRTPLTRIGVALDLASEGDSEAARASLAEIAVDVAELETIVDDILTAMRFEVGAGDFPLKRAVVPPLEIAEAAASRLRARHAARPLAVHVASDLPAIHVDRVLFRRVIDNLLENGHKYTPDTAAPLALDVTAEAGDVVFTVRDRGAGIPADDLPRVFTAFFRGDKSRSRETGGVGLGLTLAKRIVEAHGGTIELASTPDDGTTVRVAVPAVR